MGYGAASGAGLGVVGDCDRQLADLSSRGIEPIVIDWWYVGAHALWIGGLALLLATYSYRSGMHRRSILQISDQTILKSRGDRVYAIGIMLVGLGICATSTGLGMRGIGCVLALVALVQVCLDIWRTYR